MRKKSIILLLILLPTFIHAQNAYDALRFSLKYYDGTAKSLAMGNAFTALGGDMGAIPINPAAGGVYRYSEVTITPILNFSVDHTSYSGNNQSSNRTAFGLSNFGYAGAFKTGYSQGLKYFNFSITYNQTNNFNARTSASGINAQNSWAASLAAGMTGINPTSLDMYKDDPYYPFYNSYNSWDAILGWNTNLIDNMSEGSTDYIAATENIRSDGSIVLGGPLTQSYYREIGGFNSDIAFNFSGNVSDKLFFGLNLTVTNLFYSKYESYSETAQNPNDFQTGFRNFTHVYRQTSSGVGFNLKAGLIYLPVAGLRLGAAISTPTWMTLNDEWDMSMQTSFQRPEKSSSLESPLGVYKYKINTPFVWNLGAAYTFGHFALVSLDYENTNYSYVRLRESGADSNTFEKENNFAKHNFQMLHSIRFGTEVKVIPCLALRAGYSYYSSPEKDFNTDRHLASFGIGYRSRGGFFVDLGYQHQCNYNKEIFALYDAYTNSGEIPSVEEKYLNWKLILSLGIRF